MEPTSRIFVAGHRGLVGSAILRELERRGYSNVVFRTREELNLLDEAEAPTTSVLDAAKPPLSQEDLSLFHPLLGDQLNPKLLEDQLNPKLLGSTIPESTGMEGSGFPVWFVQSTGVPPVNPSSYRSSPITNTPEPTTLGLFIAVFGTVLLGWLIHVWSGNSICGKER